MSDHAGAAFLLDALPAADVLSLGYDSDGYRVALEDKGIRPCIPPRKTRKVQHAYDHKIYRVRHKVENMFGRLKDWRRVATRYDRCAHTFMSAIGSNRHLLAVTRMSPEPSFKLDYW